MALRCQQELAELVIDTGEERLSITASIGCAIVTPKNPIKHILAQADKAMYDAKKAGRNCIATAGINLNLGNRNAPIFLLIEKTITYLAKTNHSAIATDYQ